MGKMLTQTTPYGSSFCSSSYYLLRKTILSKCSFFELIKAWLFKNWVILGQHKDNKRCQELKVQSIVMTQKLSTSQLHISTKCSDVFIIRFTKMKKRSSTQLLRAQQIVLLGCRSPHLRGSCWTPQKKPSNYAHPLILRNVVWKKYICKCVKDVVKKIIALLSEKAETVLMSKNK